MNYHIDRLTAFHSKATTHFNRKKNTIYYRPSNTTIKSTYSVINESSDDLITSSYSLNSLGIFKIILCILLTGIFVFGSYQVESKNYFGEYAKADNITNYENYSLATGQTIKQLNDSYGLTCDYEYNNYDWSNKINTLSRLRNPFTYDFIQLKYSSTKWNDRDNVPTSKDLSEFDTIINYRDNALVSISIDNGSSYFYFDYNLNCWQIVSPSIIDYQTRHLNDKISGNNTKWYNYIAPIMFLPINVLTNIIYDCVVVLDFVNNW